MRTRVLTHKESFTSRHGILIDALIIVALMVLSVALRLPTLAAQDSSHPDHITATDDEGYLYLSDPDSYYYARRTRDYAAEDSIWPHAIPDTVRTSLSGDTSSRFDLFSYSMSLFYRIATSYGVSDNAFFVYAGPILFSFSIIPAYIFIRRRAGRFGAIFAGILVGFSPAFFPDSNFACYDSDIILFVLPLTVFTCLLESLDAKHKKPYIIYTIVSLSSLALLLLSWSTADVYLYLIFGFAILLFVWKWIEKRKFSLVLQDSSVRRVGIYLIIGIIITFVVNGSLIPQVIIDATSSIMGPESSGPSPGKYVSELSVSTFITEKDWLTLTTGSVVADAGGIIIFFVTVCTLIYFGIRAIVHKKPNEFLLFLPWTVATLFAAIIASRFSKLICIPIALIAPYGLGLLYEYIKRRRPEWFGLYVFLSIIFIGIPLLGTSLYDELHHGDSNDSLVSASRFISEDNGDRTDSIIVSWWDPGYIYEYETNLLTLMDGGTYNGHFYQQVTRMLLSSDPAISEKIIRDFLAEISCDAKYLYIPIDKSYSSSGFIAVFKYYADYGSETPYEYQGSIMESIIKGEDIGNFKYLATISNLNSPTINIYALDLK